MWNKKQTVRTSTLPLSQAPAWKCIPHGSAIRIIGLLLTLFLILTACSSSGSDSGNASTVKQGRFTFGPTQGLTYTCKDLSGETDGAGTYEYYENESVSFYVGTQRIGTATGKARITPKDFTDLTDTYPVCIFLLRMDSDQNPINGISIDETLAAQLGQDQEYYPHDICQSLVWQGTTYRIFFDSPSESEDCEPVADETLIHITLENGAIKGFRPLSESGTAKQAEDDGIFSLGETEFDTDPSLANLFLNNFASSGINSFMTYYQDTNQVLDGWYSPFWSLPEPYRNYQRDLSGKFLDSACFTPYTGVYSGSFDGKRYSGNLRLQISLNYFAGCTIRNVYGSTCNGNDISVYGDVSDDETGDIEFEIPEFGLLFIGNDDPEAGILSGSFYDLDDNEAGTFSCKR